MARTRKAGMGELLESELPLDGSSDSLEVPLQQAEIENTPEHIEDTPPQSETEPKEEEKEEEETEEEFSDVEEEGTSWELIVPNNSYIKEGVLYGPDQRPILDADGELIMV